MPNMLRVLMDVPVAFMTAMAPRSTMGTATMGMTVALRLCRKRNMMTATSMMASMSVRNTLWMDACTKGTVE